MKIYLISLLVIFLSYIGFTKVLQNSFFNFFSPVIVTLKNLSVDIKEYSVLLGNLDEVRKENTRMKILISEMKTKNTQDTVNSINQRELDSIKISKNMLIRKIIYYDSFGSKLILDNSDSKKIPENSLVLIDLNLIGLTEASNGDIIEVKLLSSKDLIVNTYIINSKQFKIKTVLDSESGDSLTINNILATEDVEVGDSIVTSNNNELILPDLVVGRVQRIEGISSQTFRKAYIEKNYDLNLRSYVGIMVDE